MDWGEYVDDELEQQVIAWRRQLHANPELGFQEFKTTSLVIDLLQQWQVPFARPIETGAVATVRGTRPGPTVAIRCELDALPIQEENQSDFRSQIDGRMHACGHDGHTAVQLGLVKVMSELRNEIRGEIRFLFQPAEEVIESGGRQFIECGVLNDVDVILGAHLSSDLDVGKISLRSGPILASMDEFYINVAGSGGHGAFPHQTTDALVICASLVGELQTLISRRVDPLQPAVLSIGSMHAGTAFNVISPRADLNGTVRTLSESVRDLIETEMQRMCTRHASGFGAIATVDYRRGNPILVNDSRLVDWLKPIAGTTVGERNVVSMAPMMGGDDFARYLQIVPGAYVFIGARNPSVGADKPHHHPQFTIDETALTVALRFLVNVIEQSSSSAGQLPTDLIVPPTSSLVDRNN